MSPTPDDLLAAAQMCSERLLELRDRDWETQVVGLDWSCRQTLEHVASLAYGPVLATRARDFRPLAWIVRDGAPVEELVWTAHTLAIVLAEVARAAPSGARAFHPAGMADASGFVAMGIDELLVHTHDIVTALGGTFRPPDRLTTVVLDRLFPWWPRREPLWEALLWANGRAPLEGEEDPGSSWLWHCAPIDEWDGRVPAWDPISHEPLRNE